MGRVQAAAALFSRSGVLAADRRASRAACLRRRRQARPRAGAGRCGESTPSGSGSAGEIARCEAMLANDAFVRRGTAGARRGRARQARALPRGARRARARRRRPARPRSSGTLLSYGQPCHRPPSTTEAPSSKASRPGPSTSGSSGSERLLADLGDAAATLPRDPRRRHQRQDLDDADDGGAPARVRACWSERRSRPTCAPGASGSRSTERMPTSPRRSSASVPSPRARRSSSY